MPIEVLFFLLHFLIEDISVDKLQHVVKISANLEMFELEPLLKFVELSWNDPGIICHLKFIMSVLIASVTVSQW